MANEGLIIDVDYNITKAEAKQRKLNRDMDISVQKAENIKNKIEELNSSLEDEKNKQKEIREQIAEQTKEAAELARQIDKVKSGDATMQEIIDLGSIDTAQAKLNQMEKEIKDDEHAFEKSRSASKKITSEITAQNLALKKQNAETAKIGDQIILNGKKQSKFSQAFGKSTKSADRFGKRLKSLIASALFFSVVTKAFTALRNEFGKLINETGTKTASLIAQINGNLAVIGRTLYESARPAIEWLLQGLVKITNLLANGLAKILGKNVNEMKKLAKQTKKTGEEAKKTTASFDTIQTLNGSSDSSSSENKVGTDFSALNDGIDSEVALLMAILSGALLVLGVILAFTGVNIPLGIGLIIAGAVGLATAVVPNWNDLSDKIQNTIIIITAIVSMALLVLGAIFAFTGHIALGVGFLILGAVGLATTVALSMNKLPDNIRNTVSIIAAIVSGALLVIGIILLATGVASGLGLGLLVAGAAGLAGTLAANWNSMPEKTKAVISSIMGIGGALMLILGIILTCTGNIALGVPLIAIGAASLVGSVALNWNAITDKVKSIASTIGKLFKNCWDGIKNGFKSMVNGIISFANIWIDGLNLLLLPIRGLITGIAKAFGSNIKLNDIKIPHIPKLATGAVLPGGSPMLAWVNDQPKGQPYVEGSIENIAAAFEKYLGNKGFGNQNITIEATGNWAQFIKWMNLQIKQENNRASIWG